MRFLKEGSAAYNAELQSTPLGRRSFDLRMRALEDKQAGRLPASHELFLRASNLHSDDDTSAAAAAAWHDLAQSFMDQEQLLPEERYRQAELLLRRSAQSTGRRKYPIQCAMTLSMLASCLRYQASELPPSKHTVRMLDEAEGFSEEAVTLMEQLGPPGIPGCIKYLFNLGNLREQRRKWDGAIEAYDKGLRLQHLLGGGASRSLPPVAHAASLALARVLAARGKPEDRQRALQLLEDVARQDPEQADEAWLWRATVLADEPARQEEARKALERINPESLSHERISLLAGLYERLDPASEQALKLFRDLAAELMQRRKKTVTDLSADHLASEAQDAAGAAARILVTRGDAVSAFIELENVSGLRYLEALHAYHYRPSDPVSNALWQERLKLATQASFLATCASTLSLLPVEEQREQARTMATEFQEQATQDARFRQKGLGSEWIIGALRGATSEPFPAEYLRALSEDRTEDTHRAIAVLWKRLSGKDREGLFGSDFLDASSLERILAEEPDTVFVRLHLDRDLLAVAVWLEEGRLMGKACRAAVPQHGWSLIPQALRDPERADFQQWNEMLASIDISSAFPSAARRRVILLPSYLSAFLPLAALGPVGRRPLDLFGSILWLPSLAPLMSRQVAQPPRQGTLTVLPDKTPFPGLATRLPLPNERRMKGAQTVPEEVAEQARTADVICFYAHGFHAAPHEPHLKLHGDQRLNRSHLIDQWAGAERVELWACQSGVNAPQDPRAPVVDEAFGFDFEFLRVGVRSAIGTLWKVPGFVTACIVNRFRHELLLGRDAAEALAQAQRWWTGAGLDSFIEHLRQGPEEDGFQRFTSSLGATPTQEDMKDMLSSLGSEARDPGEPMPEAELEYLRVRFGCPLSWAGFRFVGIPERRPLEPWTDEHARPVSEEIRREVERLLSEAEKASEPPSAKERLEEALEAALVASTQRELSPEEVLSLARLYCARQRSSHLHNLLLALTWLHEALASPSLAAHERARLSTEAAHLWLDLASGELPDLNLAGLHKPAPTDLLRAEHCLAGEAPASGALRASYMAAKARLRILQALAAPERGKSWLEAAIHQAWALLTPVLGELQEPTPEALRVMWTACEVLLLEPRLMPRAGLDLLKRCGPLFPSEQRPFKNLHQAPFLARLWEAAAALADALGERMKGPLEALAWLPPHELVRSTLRRLLAQGQDAVQDPNWFWGTTLSSLEDALWGEPSDDRFPLVASTGTPGFAYRWALAFYLLQHCSQGNPRDPGHFIACTQLACDLRLTFFHRLARTHRELWTTLRQREYLLDTLRDSSLHAAPSPWPTAQPSARAVHALGDKAKNLWSGILSTLPKKREGHSRRVPLLELNSKLEILEDELGRVPRGKGVLAILLGLSAAPLAAALWHDKRGLRGHVVRSQDLGLGMTLAAVLEANESEARYRAWEKLEKHLAPFIEQLLRPATEEALHWSVIAPGALRPLPWLGLPMGGKHRLYQRVASLRLLPSFGFEEPLPQQEQATQRACLLLPEHEEGDTSFGEAAIGTLRNAFPPEVLLDPSLQVDWSHVRSLRVYGSGSRAFTSEDTLQVLLPGCEEVELWAASSGGADASLPGLDAADRIPGLAGNFLACGARAVLDLAWPIHDLVKALVCEQFAHARAENPRGAAALCLAVQRTRDLLAQWSKQARRSSSLPHALGLLDERRRASMAGYLPPDALLPFADRHGAPSLRSVTVDGLIKDLLHPSHLAAFRWWGS
ncbi:CHAT domain-containing protein [Hyalangium rubrum]|uniref:CHAT domain-containing protein n=1 Tax=Hyalangium rubrum TaxID=3103134 RepID=A0ABU5HEM5_9BACT|nr:CHAT domain-containing protein [Hyalangium sp. s54d21]MDY7231706.1 CHAT domain-containing protein [Hyalangium sp. s54d21]